MQSQATLLYHLQTLDLNLERRRARLKEIDALLNGDETVAQAAQALNSAETTLKPWQTRARDLDLEIKSVAEKVKTNDADLYSGRLSNPKALQELQDEIASLKRHQGELEEALLEAMVQVEQHQAEVGSAQQTLVDARSTLSAHQAELVDERQRLVAEIAQAEAERKEAASVIQPSSLAAYDKLRPRFRGHPVALLEEECCSICGVGQTSVGLQHIRLGRTIVYCESCGRILANIS